MPFPREIVALKQEREEERRTLESQFEDELRPSVWRALETIGRERVAFILQKLLSGWPGNGKKD